MTGAAAIKCTSAALCFEVLEQVKDAHAQSVRNDLDGVQRRVGLIVLDTAQVGLIETTFFTQLNLANPRGETEFCMNAALGKMSSAPTRARCAG